MDSKENNFLSRFAGIASIKDKKEQTVQLEQLADEGYAPAQEMIGQFYYDGNNEFIPHDIGKAKFYFSKAADQGEAHSQYMVWAIADKYNKRKVYDEYSYEFQNLKKAAEQKDVAAICIAAGMYAYGGNVNGNEAWKIEINLQEALRIANFLTDEELAKEDDSVKATISLIKKKANVTTYKSGDVTEYKGGSGCGWIMACVVIIVCVIIILFMRK